MILLLATNRLRHFLRRQRRRRQFSHFH